MLLIIIGAEGIAGWGSWGPGRQDLLGHDTKSSGHEANGWSFGLVGNLRRCLEVAIDRLLWLLDLLLLLRQLLESHCRTPNLHK